MFSLSNRDKVVIPEGINEFYKMKGGIAPTATQIKERNADHDNFKAFLSVFFAGHGTVPNAGSVSAEKGLQLNSSLDDNTEDEIMVVATPEQTPFEMKDSQKSTFSITGITPDAGAEITSRNSVRPWIGDIESASRARTLGKPTRPGYLDEDVTVLPRQLRPWPLKQSSRYGAKDDSR